LPAGLPAQKLLTPAEGAAAGVAAWEAVADAWVAADVRRWGTSAAGVGDHPAEDPVATEAEASVRPRDPAPVDLRWAEDPSRRITRDLRAELARRAPAREATVRPADGLALQAPRGDQADRRSAVDRH
jgi:hypothetical protein